MMSCTAQIASSLGRTTLPFCEHDRESLNRRLALNSCNHVTISADPRLDAKATISYVMCNVGKKRGDQLTLGILKAAIGHLLEQLTATL